MPISHQNLDHRATKDLHADWWDPKRTQDGTLHTPEVGPEVDGRYVERVVVYAQRFYYDDEWIQSQAMGDFDPKKKKFDASQAVKVGRLTMQRLIVEITDAAGVVQPRNVQGDLGPMYSGKFFANMDSRDTAWIQEQLEALKEPPVEVTEVDHHVAAQRAARHQHLTVVQQFPEDHPLVQANALHTPEEVALARFSGDL